MSGDSAGLQQRLTQVNARIERACRAAGRDRESVQLLAVSKRQPAAAIQVLATAGQHCFGENYMQEAQGKMAELAGLPLEWHLIGPLQGNKTRSVAEHFAWVHSIDRIKLAQRLSAQRPQTLPALNVCVQVNISNEASKSGATAGQAPELCHAVSRLPCLKLRGLMCIPAPTRNGEAPRPAFAAMRQLFAKLCAAGLPLDTLSMGMSADLEAAIAEGATMVRIGTDLFGPRSP